MGVGEAVRAPSWSWLPERIKGDGKDQKRDYFSLRSLMAFNVLSSYLLEVSPRRRNFVPENYQDDMWSDSGS